MKAKYLGCYKDSTDARDLDGKTFSILNINQCLKYCALYSFKYAGLQFG